MMRELMQLETFHRTHTSIAEKLATGNTYARRGLDLYRHSIFEFTHFKFEFKHSNLDIIAIVSHESK